MRRRKPRSQMSINLRPLALGREVSEKGCGCFAEAERLRFPTPLSSPPPPATTTPTTTTTSSQTPKLRRGEEMWGLLTSLRKSENATGRASDFAPRAFCGCFIAGRLSHKCHTNLDSSHLMSVEAAAVLNRQLFAHCCRRVSPRVSSLHSAGPVARRSRCSLGKSALPLTSPARH